MKHLIRAGLALAPLAVFADPGHGAPALHTHFWEVLGWMVAIGVVVGFVVRHLRTKYNRS